MIDPERSPYLLAHSYVTIPRRTRMISFDLADYEFVREARERSMHDQAAAPSAKYPFESKVSPVNKAVRTRQ